MGGHDGLLLSQRYPDDFDGIVARAPAGNVVGLFQQFNRIGSLVHNSESVLSAEQRDKLANAVLAQCDHLDGLRDGIMAQPQRCDFDASTLSCSKDTSEHCLSDKQLELVVAITTPLLNDDNELIHPGYNAGGANNRYSWEQYIWPQASGLSAQMLFSEGFIRSFITGDKNYDTWRWEANEWQPELKRIRAMFDAFDPDINAFSQRGAKLIMWNGTLDTSVSYLDSIRYYESVLETLGRAKTDKTLELFLGPGVGHCGGGVGPDRVDLMSALSTWVENGVAPSQQQLVLTKVNEDAEVVLSRPMCKYPAFAKYKGTGDASVASNFSCEEQ